MADAKLLPRAGRNGGEPNTPLVSIRRGGLEVDKEKKLKRSRREKILAGVCGGVAEYFSVDPVLVRLIWAAFALLEGAGILLYIVAWIVMPEGND